MVSASGSSHPRKNSWFHEAVAHCVSEMKTNAHCDNTGSGEDKNRVVKNLQNDLFMYFKLT